ncbi:MAG: MFS transporter [Chloroflexota bacterium]|nr:MFS transporter [Chloroflexota bacterium]
MASFRRGDQEEPAPPESAGAATALERRERMLRRRGRFRYGTFASFQYRDFRFLWLGQISQAMALWMEQIARPLLVLSDLVGGDARDLGLVFAVRTIPQLIAGLFAGVIADWYDRRLVLLTAKTGSAVTNFALAFMILSGDIELWHIYVQAFAKGMFNAMDQPARQSLIPSIVPQRHLTNAVALNSASMNTMRIAGASVAGLMVAFVGFGMTFLAAAIIFLGAVYFTYRLNVPAHVRHGQRNVSNALASFREGIAYGWRTPSIRWVILLAMIYFSFGMSYMQVFAPLFAKEVLEIGERGFGFMMSLTGAGGVIGALTLASLNPRRHRGLGIMGIMAAFGIMLIIFSLSTFLDIVALSIALVLFVGMFQTPFNSLTNSVLLDSAPAEMRGRVMALISMDRSVITIGATLAGFAAHGLGVQFAQMIFAGVVLGGVFVMLTLVPAFRRIQ